MSFITRVKAITRTVSHFLGEGIWNIDLAGLSPKRGKLYKHLKIILIKCEQKMNRMIEMKQIHTS